MDPIHYQTPRGRKARLACVFLGLALKPSARILRGTVLAVGLGLGDLRLNQVA
jgi:hypothetical protein